MEDTHQKLVHDLQRQHQREIANLLEERERLLAEETAATIAGKENSINRRLCVCFKTRAADGDDMSAMCSECSD